MTRLERARAASLARRQSQTANARPVLGASTDSLRIKPSGYVGRKGKACMTGAQRNSEGRRSEWSMSPEFWTDPKWSATVSSR